MNIYFFQHVPYESPGHILQWVREKGHNARFVNFYEKYRFPEIDQIDGLVIMGGPMNIYDDEEFTWLETERDYLKKVILEGKKVIGICLGSQMIADAMGALVKRNEHTEIGWFKVKVDNNKVPTGYSGIFPDEFITFHWHGDTFDVPENAIQFIHSEATANQAFIKDHVAGFQFHMEMTIDGIRELIEHNDHQDAESLPYVQSAGQMLGSEDRIEANKVIMFKFLDRFFAM